MNTLDHTRQMMDRTFAALEPQRLKERRNGHMVDVFGKFGSEMAAQEAIAAYECRFHPEGYGTMLTMSEREGWWLVSGHRLASCG